MLKFPSIEISDSDLAEMIGNWLNAEVFRVPVRIESVSEKYGNYDVTFASDQRDAFCIDNLTITEESVRGIVQDHLATHLFQEGRAPRVRRVGRDFRWKPIVVTFDYSQPATTPEPIYESEPTPAREVGDTDHDITINGTADEYIAAGEPPF